MQRLRHWNANRVVKLPVNLLNGRAARAGRKSPRLYQSPCDARCSRPRAEPASGSALTAPRHSARCLGQDAAVAQSLFAQHRRGQWRPARGGDWPANARAPAAKPLVPPESTRISTIRNSLTFRKLCQEPRRTIGTSCQSKSPSRSGPSCSTALSAVVASIRSISTSTPWHRGENGVR